MAYRITTDGVLETDTAQEALEFLQLCAKQTPTAPTKRKYVRHQTARTDQTATQEAQPTATKHGVKIGQIWRKRWDKNKNYRTIQIGMFTADGVVPIIIKSGGTSGKKGGARFMKFSHLEENYKLVKDV